MSVVVFLQCEHWDPNFILFSLSKIWIIAESGPEDGAADGDINYGDQAD
jgi:hypothetical protein